MYFNRFNLVPFFLHTIANICQSQYSDLIFANENMRPHLFEANKLCQLGPPVNNVIFFSFVFLFVFGYK